MLYQAHDAPEQVCKCVSVSLRISLSLSCPCRSVSVATSLSQRLCRNVSVGTSLSQQGGCAETRVSARLPAKAHSPARPLARPVRSPAHGTRPHPMRPTPPPPTAHPSTATHPPNNPPRPPSFALPTRLPGPSPADPARILPQIRTFPSLHSLSPRPPSWGWLSRQRSPKCRAVPLQWKVDRHNQLASRIVVWTELRKAAVRVRYGEARKMVPGDGGRGGGRGCWPPNFRARLPLASPPLPSSTQLDSLHCLCFHLVGLLASWSWGGPSLPAAPSAASQLCRPG